MELVESLLILSQKQATTNLFWESNFSYCTEKRANTCWDLQLLEISVHKQQELI